MVVFFSKVALPEFISFIYASLFNSIEINSIFYKLPRGSTIVNWAESVRGNFRFTFKVSKTITHAKGLQLAAKDVDDFNNTVGAAIENLQTLNKYVNY